MSDKVWNYYPHIWKTEAAYLSWVRGNIRNIWKNSPQRNEFCKSKLIKVQEKDSEGNPVFFKNSKPKIVNAYLCNCCGKECYPKDKVKGSKRTTYAVDHIKGNHSLTSFDQAPSFFEAMLCVSPEDLQILCHECHDIKTYSEKYKCTEEEARIRKQIAKIVNEKEDKLFFTTRGLDIPSNLAKRKEAMFNYLLDSSNKVDVCK